MFSQTLGGLVRSIITPMDELQAEQDGYHADREDDRPPPSPRLRAAWDRGRSDRSERGA